VERLLKEALARQPQARLLGNFLAGLYEQEGRWEEAVAAYRAVLKDNGRDVMALNNLAYLLALRGGDTAEALALVERAVELAGPVGALLDTRGVVHLKRGQTEQAVKDLQQALMQASSPGRYLHLALAHHRGRDRAAAARAWRQVTASGLGQEAVHPLEREDFVRLTRELR
jgi:Tfp pilus assembly protein PilF